MVLMGDGDNLGEALSTAKARFPDGHVVVVGDSRRRELVTTVIASEATSFVDENVATSTLIKQLELIAQGEPMISVLLLKRLLRNGSTPPSVEAMPTLEIDKSQPPDTDEEARPNPQLSGREAAILNALVQGAPNKVIAYQLNITEATVKVHVKAVLRKIRVTNRTQAAIWALHHQALPKPAHAGNGEVALTEGPRRRLQLLVTFGFDLLFQNSIDLRGLSFTERQRDLKRLCANRRVPCLYLVETFPEGGPLLEWCSNYGLEGIVSKRRTSGYASGPSRHWVKTKCANWKRDNAERHLLFEKPRKPELTDAQKTLAKKRQELARVLDRLRAPGLSQGMTRELRKHAAILKREIAELEV